MRQLTCEMCGGTDFVKQDGVFVCQSCGVKYTVEEARKIMIEGTVDVSGSTVKVDNTHLISNYIEMALNAYSSGNQAEAESYCNKIIEIEPANYTAWMLKGKAAGWQSTLQNPRVPESVSAFSKAIEYAPEEEKENLINEAKEEIKNLAKAMLTLRADRFVKWPDAEETTGFVGDLTTITNAVAQFISKAGVLIPISEIMRPAATIISQSVSKAWTGKIQPEYKGNGLDLPSQYDYSKFLDRVGHCTALLETAINLAGDDEDNISRYEDLIMLNQQAIDNCGYDYKFWNYGSDSWQINNMINALKKDGVIPDPRHDRYWFKCTGLNASALVKKQDAIKNYKEKIASIKSEKARKEAAERAEKERKAKEEAKKEFDAYWIEHAEEKKQLEQDLSGLKERLSSIISSRDLQVNELKQKKNEIPGEQEVNTLGARILELNEKKNNLSIFKNKEKTAIQEEVDQLDIQRKAIADRMESEKNEIQKQIRSIEASYRPEIKDLQKRINAINNRLGISSEAFDQDTFVKRVKASHKGKLAIIQGVLYALCSDGTIKTTRIANKQMAFDAGKTKVVECTGQELQTGGWPAVRYIEGAGDSLIGITSDGNVIVDTSIEKDNKVKETLESTRSWKNIKTIKVRYQRGDFLSILGITIDGTVRWSSTIKNIKKGLVESWRDVLDFDVAVTGSEVVAVTNTGKVLWTINAEPFKNNPGDIIQIFYIFGAKVGLRSNGQCVQDAMPGFDNCVATWKNVIKLEMCGLWLLGITADGSVYINSDDQGMVSLMEYTKGHKIIHLGSIGTALGIDGKIYASDPALDSYPEIARLSDVREYFVKDQFIIAITDEGFVEIVKNNFNGYRDAISENKPWASGIKVDDFNNYYLDDSLNSFKVCEDYDSFEEDLEAL